MRACQRSRRQLHRKTPKALQINRESRTKIATALLTSGFARQNTGEPTVNTGKAHKTASNPLNFANKPYLARC
jgi:hypothetical protein